MSTKKNIILKSVDGGEEKGILSLEFDDENLSGNLRLYSFASEPRGILTLGITTAHGVIKAGLTKRSNMCYNFLTQAKSLPENFSCALVNFLGGEGSPLLFGSTENLSASQIEGYRQVASALTATTSAQQVERVLDDYGVDYDDELKEEIEKEIDHNMSGGCGDCANCIYKQHFYETMQHEEKGQDQQAQVLQKSDEKEKDLQAQQSKKDKDEDKSFFKEIKSQVTTLFEDYKPEEFLQSAIENSRFVKVDCQGPDYYVFGLIYQEDELKYVCYGVPALFTPLPPKQLSGYPVWFPVDKNKPEGFGYWLTYQDAATGESVKAVIE